MPAQPCLSPREEKVPGHMNAGWNWQIITLPLFLNIFFKMYLLFIRKAVRERNLPEVSHSLNG